MQISTPIYKVAIVGDAAVGKTNLVHALKEAGFERRYIATAGAEVHPIAVQTNDGGMFVDLWDMSGAESRWYGDNPLSLAGMHLVVITYALDKEISYRHALGYWKERTGAVPVMMVGLKADIEPTVVPPATDIQVSSKDDATSVRNFWERVIQRLTGDDGTHILY